VTSNDLSFWFLGEEVFPLTIRAIRAIVNSRGEDMKRSELVRKLRKDGWIITHGGKHSLANHPTKRGKIPIPNGNTIKDTTAKGIMRSAGLI